MRKLGITVLVVLLSSVVFAQTNAAGPQTVTVTLTSADLQNLRETAVVLVSAPGAGNYINASSATLQYNYGTTNYPGGHGRLQISLGPYFNTDPICTFDGVLVAGFLDQNSDQTVTLESSSLQSVSAAENLDLEIVNFGPPLTDGDGTLTITVIYTVEALP